MAKLGFLRRDFEVFAIKDVDARLAKIDDLIRPRLTRLGTEMAPELSQRLQIEFFPHVARQVVNHETWAAFGPSPKGYKRFGYLALCISGAGIHARAVVKSTADKRAEIGRAIKLKSSELERSFRGTKIQDYDGWNCRTLPHPIVASRAFFDALGDALAEKSGAIDVGFGWLVHDALRIDRAEVLDAFGELAPLYRAIGPSS
jgi:uncharacterized protein YktB (UPF0637 family)